MRKIGFLILLSIIILTNLTNCKRECRTVRLKNIKCKKNYEQLNVQEVFLDRDAYYNYSQKGMIDYFKITDSIAYDSTFTPNRPFGEINFVTHSLIGMDVNTDWAKYVEYQSYVCYNNLDKKWIFTTEYTLAGQCNGSEISGKHYSTWFITPKIPNDYVVVFNPIDVNPM